MWSLVPCATEHLTPPAPHVSIGNHSCLAESVHLQIDVLRLECASCSRMQGCGLHCVCMCLCVCGEQSPLDIDFSRGSSPPNDVVSSLPWIYCLWFSPIYRFNLQQVETRCSHCHSAELLTGAILGITINGFACIARSQRWRTERFLGHRLS